MRSSEAADHFFVTVNQLQKKKVQDDESVWRCAQLLHVFCVREKHVSLVFFLPTTHEFGKASAAQVDRSHDVSPLLGPEVSEAHLKRVGREGGLALRTNPSGTRPATVRIRLGSPSPRRTTKNDSMNVGRVALLDVRTRDSASSELISKEDGRGLKHKRATVTNKVRPTLRATWMLSRTSRDRNIQRKGSQVLSQDVPLSVLDVKEPTKQHHDTLW